MVRLNSSLLLGLLLGAAVFAVRPADLHAQRDLATSPQAVLRTSPIDLQLKPGGSMQATAYYEVPGIRQTATNVTWSSSDSRVAEVSSGGMITAISSGKARVNVQAGKRKTVIQVVVKP